MASVEKVDICHHAHLFVNDNEIELRIFFNPKTYFGRKFDLWLSKINWRSFSSFISVEKANENPRLLKIDFSDSLPLLIKNSTAQYEGHSQYISIYLDSAKFYWIPSVDDLNTGEFYFNDVGFNVVKDFYAPLFGWYQEFNFSRMENMDQFYKIEKAEFRPEFNFGINDDRMYRQATIKKEPKLQFHYKEQVTEEEAVKYGEIIRVLASFYFHKKIDFILQRIHLAEYTITIKKLFKESNDPDSTANLWGLKNHWSFHKLLQSNWQTKTLNNFKKLSKVIELFNHSHVLDSSSKFLIRYNVIEVCSSGSKNSNEKFQQILNKNDCKKIYDQSLKLLLQTIPPSDHK
jgi:hypothetical protein